MDKEMHLEAATLRVCPKDWMRVESGYSVWPGSGLGTILSCQSHVQVPGHL